MRTRLSTKIRLCSMLACSTVAHGHAAQPTNPLPPLLQDTGQAVTDEAKEVLERTLSLLRLHKLPTDLPLVSIRRDERAKEWVAVFATGRPDEGYTVFLSGKDADSFELKWPIMRGRMRYGPADLPREPTVYPGCVKIFNGENLNGWEADSSTWSIVDGAMRGVGGSSRLAFTKKDYGSFRLIFTSRMNPVNGDHLGVLFWGDRPNDASQPKIDNAGWIQFMPPHGAMWDYHPPKHYNLPHETLESGPRDFTTWHTTELLCNLEKGTMRAAVDGVEITRYTHTYPSERTDPEKRIVPGPIGMFRHGGGASEYKNIYLEENPKEDRLVTVR